MAAFGLKPDEPLEAEACGVWPENWQGLCVFLRMQTQWRVGMAGPVGLVYDSVQMWLEIEGVQREDWPKVLDCVQGLEAASLRLMRKG